MQTDLMHGSVLVVGQVQPFGPWRSCPGGRGVGEIKKYLLFDFAKYVLFLARFHDGCRPQDYIFLRKKQEFVAEWLGRNNFSKLKSVFKGMFLNLKQMCI